MKEEKRQCAREAIRNSRIFIRMERIQKYLDDYYLDAIVGLLPWGVGDLASALFSLIYIWFAAIKIRSLPLVLAILNNVLRDIMLGLIPFYVGDIIDIFHRANRQNMILIKGFVDGNQEIIRTVNHKAWQSAIFIIIFIILICILLWITVEFTFWIFNFLFN